MPKKYAELVSQATLEEYHYQVARNTHSKEEFSSQEKKYRLLAKELAQKNPPLIIPYVEITVSVQCTLKCVDCSNLMPYYTKPTEMDLEACKQWVSHFLEAVDHVLMFRVMGGEPLMQKNLIPFLEFLRTQLKIEHIQIVTNGTLLLSAEQILFLANNKLFSLAISHYPKSVASKYQALINQCIQYNIQGITSDEEMEWLDYGDLRKRERSVEDNEKVYRDCMQNCRHIWQGELHVCPRSAHGMALNMIPRDSKYYVDLMENDIHTKRKQIRELYDVTLINACDYCNASEKRKKLLAAIQK